MRDDFSDFNTLFLNDGADSDIKFLDIQFIQNLGQLSFKEGSSPLSSLISKPFLNNFININNFDDFSFLSPAPLKKTAPSLIK